MRPSGLRTAFIASLALIAAGLSSAARAESGTIRIMW